MEKIICFLATIVLLCSSCATEENDIFHKYLMFEKIQNNAFYYTADANNITLKAVDNSDMTSLDIYTQEYFHGASFAVIGNNIYFTGNRTLYSKPLNDLESEPFEEGSLEDDIGEFALGNYDGHLNIFSYNDDIYMQGMALYRLEGNNIVELIHDLTSFDIKDEVFYYGDSQGNIYTADLHDNSIKTVLSSECIKERIKGMGSSYIDLLGGQCCVNGLQVLNGKIYFLLTPDPFNPGRVFSYDLTTEEIAEEYRVERTAINSFWIYKNTMYCYGLTGEYNNALFSISEDTATVLCPYISGFKIIDDIIYYYDLNTKKIEEKALKRLRISKHSDV